MKQQRHYKGIPKVVARLICIVLASAMLLSGFQGGAITAYAEEAVILGNTQDAFTPVFRFAVTSDVHVRGKNSGVLNGYEQLESFYSTVYKYSESQEYKGLDGIFFIGDNTQTGSAEEQTYFFDYLNTHTKEGTYVRAAMGNHEFKATGKNYADPAGATAKFLEYSGYESEDIRFELGGYQFIMLSPDLYDKTNAKYFSATKIAWLEQELAVAAATSPDKPIFVMQHQPPRYTMVGSHGISGDADLTEVLSQYPQVIDFSGHTHCTMTDPRIIWQDSFTALNTASLCYLTLPVIDDAGEQISVKATNGEGSWYQGSLDSAVRNAGMYYIVELDENGAVRVLIYNMFTQSVWGVPFILDTLNPEEFVYTDDRANDAVKPGYPTGAALQLHSNNYKNVLISIPQAQCKDVVQNYRVEVYKKDTLVDTIYRLSGANYGDAAPERVKVYISGLEPSTDYTVKVYATSSWGVHSEPLTLAFKTGLNVHTIEADILDVAFAPDGTVVNAANGMALETHGEPAVTYDEALGQYVAEFDGIDDLYSYTDISYWYDIIATNFTLESHVWLDAKPTKSNMNPFSNLQSAGIGFLCATDGNVRFYNMTDGTEYTIQKTTMTPGRWVHLTGTYDGSYMRFYVDGELVAENALSGNVAVPAHLAQMLCIGADSAVGSYANYFKGKIATAKLYSRALSQEEVTELHNWTNGGESNTACPDHPSAEEWIRVKATDWENGGTIAQGHYILAEDIPISAALTVAENTSVCINLNGFDIIASGEAVENAAYRVFENSGRLTILDSALADGIISGGTAWIHGKTDGFSKGGNIYNAANAVFTLYDGVITGGTVSTGANVEAGSMGGNIYGDAGSTINIKGGAVVSGYATKGGSYTNTANRLIYGGNISSYGTVNISGGTVTGGKLSLSYTNQYAARNLYLHGGNIAVLTGGKLNVSGGVISDGLITGTRTNLSAVANAYGRGANIYLSGASATISGGSITGGRIAMTAIGTATGTTVPANAKAFGASIYITKGTMDITGGRISGGTVDSVAQASENSTSTGKATVSAYGGNFYITDGATVNMSGGTVTGGTVKHNSKAGTTSAFGGNFCVTGTGILNVSGGEISNGVSSHRGGNIAVWDEASATLSGNAVITGGNATNGSNAAVQDAAARLTLSGNVQLIDPVGKNSVYAAGSGKMEMYGGTVTGGLTVSASGSNAKFTMYGGYVETLTKTEALPITQVVLYNGKLGSNPKDQATIGGCACYTDNGDGTYNVWHEGAIDGTCKTCACNYAGKSVVMYAGSHSAAENSTICAVCGKTIGLILHHEDGTQTLLNDTGHAVRLHLTNPGSYIKLNISNVSVNIPENSTVHVDINGKKAEITGSGTLCGMDSANDTYALSDGTAAVADTVTVQPDVEGMNGNRYLAISADGVYSFHRLSMGLYAVALHPSVVGVYYKVRYQCDDTLGRRISYRGLALSLDSMPTAEFAKQGHVLYTKLTGAPVFTENSAVENSGILENILTATTAETNDANGKKPVYARPYIAVDGDGDFAADYTVVSNATESGGYSLLDILKLVNANWSAYATQQEMLKECYNTWKNWNINWDSDLSNFAK